MYRTCCKWKASYQKDGICIYMYFNGADFFSADVCQRRLSEEHAVIDLIYVNNFK